MPSMPLLSLRDLKQDPPRAPRPVPRRGRRASYRNVPDTSDSDREGPGPARKKPKQTHLPATLRKPFRDEVLHRDAVINALIDFAVKIEDKVRTELQEDFADRTPKQAGYLCTVVTVVRIACAMLSPEADRDAQCASGRARIQRTNTCLQWLVEDDVRALVNPDHWVQRVFDRAHPCNQAADKLQSLLRGQPGKSPRSPRSIHRGASPHGEG